MEFLMQMPQKRKHSMVIVIILLMKFNEVNIILVNFKKLIIYLFFKVHNRVLY